MTAKTKKTTLYTRYPFTSVLLYSASTVLHFLLGGAGIYLSFVSGFGPALAVIYLLFAFGQMYVVMPLTVCTRCTYYKLENGRCISALNLLSQRIAREGVPYDFRLRAKGLLCHNTQYLTALILPIPLMLIGLVLNFSVALLVILGLVALLLAERFLYLFPRVACVHCEAKHKCPNAVRMGIK
jgi:hypothetical protein